MDSFLIAILRLHSMQRGKKQYQAEIDNNDDVTNDIELTGVQVSKQVCVSVTMEHYNSL